jgi:hypothetical protein
MRGLDIPFSLNTDVSADSRGRFLLSMLPQAYAAINSGCPLFTTYRRDQTASIVASFAFVSWFQSHSRHRKADDELLLTQRPREERLVNIAKEHWERAISQYAHRLNMLTGSMLLLLHPRR